MYEHFNLLMMHEPVACVGASNSVQITGQPTNEAVCTSNAKLSINSVEYTYSQLGCVKQNKETLLETGTCGSADQGVQITAGWQVDADLFIEEYGMCHNVQGAFNYYSTNTIDGLSVEADDKTNGRPSFVTGGYVRPPHLSQFQLERSHK